MSVPDKHTTWGEILYRGESYGVLYGFHLNEEIWEKKEEYTGDKGCVKSTAPWATIKVSWSIEDDKLYLTKLCSDELLKEIVGSERILAVWVGELELLVEHRKICKTYERRGSYINEIKTLQLTFNQGKLMNVSVNTELYRSIEMRNYIGRNPAYATYRIDSRDLLSYVENEEWRPKEDQLFPVLSNMLEQMFQAGSKDDMSLGIKDLKNILKDGDLAVFGSAKGSNIDEMVDSLAESMTDEFLKVKGCLTRLTMNRHYPIASTERLVNEIERKMSLHDRPFYFGTLLSDELAEDEIVIRILVGI